MRRRAGSWLLLIVGLTVAAIGGQQVWAAAHPVSVSVRQAGDVPLAVPLPATSRSIQATEQAGRSAARSVGAVVESPAPVQLVHLIPGPPTAVELDAVGLDAAVVTVGVQADGAVQVPADVATVGWVASSARPGAGSGTTTMVGHVDDPTGAYGAFHRLYAARTGQTVVVRASTGEALRYRIQAVELSPRDSLPADLFQTTGRPGLALVTCAGDYSPNHGFADNLIIWAVPQS